MRGSGVVIATMMCAGAMAQITNTNVNMNVNMNVNLNANSVNCAGLMFSMMYNEAKGRQGEALAIGDKTNNNNNNVNTNVNLAGTCADYSQYTNLLSFTSLNFPVLQCMNSMAGFGFSKASQCASCVYSLTSCVGGSNCSEGKTWCQGYMTSLGCDPSWCSATGLSNDLVVTVYYTMSHEYTAAFVISKIVAQIDTLQTAWVSATLVYKPAIMANVWKITVTIPKTQTGIPPQYADALEANLIALQYITNFRAQTKITGVYSDKSCFTLMYGLDSGITNNNECSDYVNISRLAAVQVKEEMPVKKEKVSRMTTCAAAATGHKFGKSSMCLCYFNVASCVAMSGCSEGVQWCRDMMKEAGCNQGWCTAKVKPVGKVRRVVAKYILTRLISSETFLMELQKYVEGIVLEWATVHIFANGGGSVNETDREAMMLQGGGASAVVNVSVPDGQVVPSDFEQAVGQQLQDVANIAAFQTATGTTGVAITDSTSGGSSSSGLSDGAIAGIVVGCVAFCVILVIIIFCCCVGGKATKKEEEGSKEQPADANAPDADAKEQPKGDSTV